MNIGSLPCDYRMVILAAVLGSGCGQSSPLVTVKGTVSLDGKALPNAHVVFRPHSGRPSFGVTDTDGNYSLRYTAEKAGALPGEHVVSIVTGKDDDGASDDRSKAKELLPPRYNAKSTLTVTVDASRRTHDFALQSR